VAVCKVAGDGNCLFRAISLGLTNSENSHRQLRDAITRHMLQAPILQAMSNSNSNMFAATDSTWGIENEIIAAAHLLSCSIVFSQIQQISSAALYSSFSIKSSMQ